MSVCPYERGRMHSGGRKTPSSAAQIRVVCARDEPGFDLRQRSQHQSVLARIRSEVISRV